MQIADELAGHAKVTITSRETIRFVPERPLGVDLHDWLHLTGLDRLPFGAWKDGTWTPKVRVLDDGRYRRAIDAGRPAGAPCSRLSVPTTSVGAMAPKVPWTP